MNKENPHFVDYNETPNEPFTPEQIEEHGITPEQIAQYKQEDKVEGEKILGKFKTQEDLESAYKELEKKFHDKETNTNEETKGEVPEPEVKGDNNVDEGNEETSKAAEETSAEDVAKEFESLEPSEMKTRVEGAIKSLKESDELTEDVLEAFESLGIPKELVSEHKELLNFKAQQEVDSLMNLAGGKDGYEHMTKWAQTSLSPEEVRVFDNIVENGTNEEVSFAISNLKARYDGATQAPKSNLIKADAIAQAEGGYRSQAEMNADIASSEYENNPTFRRKVMDKAKRSKF